MAALSLLVLLCCMVDLGFSFNNSLNNETCPEDEVLRCNDICHEECVLEQFHCEPCEKTCRCKAGYKRDGEGICIPYRSTEQDNVICKDPHEEYRCQCECERNCDYDCVNAFHTCSRRCYCVPGYYRNPQGVCVPSSECFNLKMFKGCGRKEDCACRRLEDFFRCANCFGYTLSVTIFFIMVFIGIRLLRTDSALLKPPLV